MLFLNSWAIIECPVRFNMIFDILLRMILVGESYPV